MMTLTIPFLPDCDIQIVTASTLSDGSPVMVLSYPDIRSRLFPDYDGELGYHMITNDIFCNTTTPFYAKIFVEDGNEIVRIILPFDMFYDVINANDKLEDSCILTFMSSSNDIPEWATTIDWFRCSKPARRSKPDATQTQHRHSQTTQESCEQPRSISVNPPSRERDPVFWY